VCVSEIYARSRDGERQKAFRANFGSFLPAPLRLLLLAKGERQNAGLLQLRKTSPIHGASIQRKRFDGILGCYSPLFYRGSVRKSLHRFKFGGVYYYAETYAKLISNCIDECEISCDIITWVPVSRFRLHTRGYDQALKIAEPLAEMRGVELRPLLRKKRHNRRQSTISDPERRRRNVADLYVCTDPEAVRGKCILLVDDIVTTGSTLTSCAAALKAAGAASVEAVTVARKRNKSVKYKKDKKEHSIRLY